MSEVRDQAIAGVLMLVGIFGVGSLLLAQGPWPGWSALTPCIAGALSGLGLVAVHAFWAGRR